MLKMPANRAAPGISGPHLGFLNSLVLAYSSVTHHGSEETGSTEVSSTNVFIYPSVVNLLFF